MIRNNDGDDTTEQTHDDSLDRLFQILASERRRLLLYYLDGKNGDVATFTELIDYVMVQEAEPVDDLVSDAVAIALYHTHLPRLEDAGLIEYDERSRTVRYRGTRQMERYLQRARERELA